LSGAVGIHLLRSGCHVVPVYQEVQASRSHALKRELNIKALSRPQKEALIQTGGQLAKS
jgi:predicted GIY-YIG superfamily endonuclease